MPSILVLFTSYVISIIRVSSRDCSPKCKLKSLALNTKTPHVLLHIRNDDALSPITIPCLKQQKSGLRPDLTETGARIYCVGVITRKKKLLKQNYHCC